MISTNWTDPRNFISTVQFKGGKKNRNIALRRKQNPQKVTTGKAHETNRSIYCVYVPQCVVAGEEVTVIQSSMDHDSSIGREVRSV